MFFKILVPSAAGKASAFNYTFILLFGARLIKLSCLTAGAIIGKGGLFGATAQDYQPLILVYLVTTDIAHNV